jgi:hypothetical protein
VGAWGPAIFSDDTACDARDEWRDLIAEGRTPHEATVEVAARFAGLDDEPVAWLGMAATAWKLGRLEPDLRDRALAIIDDERPEGPLEPWHEAGPAELRQRMRALAALRAQLLSPQPAPRTLKRRLLHDTRFTIGDAILFPLRDGRSVVLVVVDEHIDRGGRAPVVHVLDWIGDGGEVPTREQLETLPTMDLGPRPNKADPNHHRRVMVFRGRLRPDPDDFRLVASDIQRTEPYSFRSDYTDWHELDAYLHEHARL